MMINRSAAASPAGYPMLARAIGLSMLISLGGCVVTEQDAPSGPQGMLLKPQPQASGADRPLSEMMKPGATATSAQSTMAIRTVGELPYDGLTLPLVSADGRYLVTQVDEPPGWEMLLAEGTPPQPVRARQRVYDLLSTPPTVVEPRTPPSGGLLLGRSVSAARPTADGSEEAGYLVEQINADGSRSIGRVGFRSGDVEWLVRDEMVNAFAIEGHNQLLVYCTRGMKDPAFSLVLRRAGDGASKEADERRLALAGQTLIFPILSADGKFVGVYSISLEGATSLLSIDIDASFAQSAELGVVVRVRHDLAPKEQPRTAFQSCSGVLAAPLWPQGTGGPGALFAIIAPRTGRPVLLDAVTTKGINMPGPSLSVAVLPDAAASVLLTRRDVVERMSLAVFSGASAPIGGVRVIARPCVVRSIGVDGKVVMVGPPKSGNSTIEVIVAQPLDARAGPTGGRAKED